MRPKLGPILFVTLMAALAVYFIYAAVQGPSGLLRRIQVEAETGTNIEIKNKLQLEVDRMRNLTRRLSDDYLDLDLLDERARHILGLIRPDEVIIPDRLAPVADGGKSSSDNMETGYMSDLG